MELHRIHRALRSAFPYKNLMPVGEIVHIYIKIRR